MKSLLALAMFATLGVFAYGPRTAPVPQPATEVSTDVGQVSCLDETTALTADSVRLGCTGNCCEVNDAGVCILCRKVCP